MTVLDAIAGRLFRLLWRLHPRRFRDRYAAQALAFAMRHAQEQRRRQRLGALRFWLRACVEILPTAVRLRRGDLLPHPRSEGHVSMFTTLFDDVRHAARALRAAPGFTIVAVLIFAVGVGGSTAVYSLLHGVILAPLPYQEPDRLGILWTWDERRDLPDGSSYANWEDWRARTGSFDDLAMYFRPEFTDQTLSGLGPPRRVQVSPVTGNFFDVLGVQPALGRVFTRDEELAATPLVILSNVFWRQELGGDDDVLGRSVELGGEAHEIIGVMPPEFRFPTDEVAMWENHAHYLGWPEREYSRGFDGFVVLGRLRTGVSFEQAQRDLDAVAGQLAVEHPETNHDMGVRLHPLLREITGTGIPRALWLLFGATVAVLMIAATNVAHLLLARGAARRREIAIRAALGAAAGRLARQQVFEALMVATASAAAGSAVAFTLLLVLVAVAPTSIPRLDQVGLDARMLAGALVATLALGLGSAVVPAWGARRAVPAAALHEGAYGSGSPAHRRFRAGLVVAQVALAMVLLAGAALFLRSLSTAAGEDAGFDIDRAVVARVDLPFASYQERKMARDFHIRLRDRVASAPGIDGVGFIEAMFLYRIPDVTLTVEGREGSPSAAPATADAVLPGFFEAIGAEIVDGRSFDNRDLEPGARSMVVNQTAAKAFWPGESPVGRRFLWGDQTSEESRYMTVVGVARDLRRRGLDVAPVAQFFAADAFRSVEVVLIGDDPESSVAALRAALAELDPTVPVSRVRVAAEWAGGSLAGRRFQSLLLGGFAALATALAAAGLFGLLHEAVTQRRRELGIRLALGAAPGALVRLVMTHAIGLMVAGVLLGIAGAALLAGAVEALLYGVGATDPTTLAGVAAGLVVVGLVAAAVPARRAVRIQPAETLVQH